MKITSEKALRAAFWNENEGLKPLRRPGRQNAQHVNVRMAFVDWSDNANREGRVSDNLASYATL